MTTPFRGINDYNDRRMITKDSATQRYMKGSAQSRAELTEGCQLEFGPRPVETVVGEDHEVASSVGCLMGRVVRGKA